MESFLVEPSWLEAKLGSDDLVALDCAWFVPEAGRSGLDAFRAEHIPTARHFDLNVASDAASPYPNMMPSLSQFAAVAGALGIDNATTVVIYDAGYVSARVWWMFRRFGHEKVYILDGGLRRWKAEGRPLESGEPAPAAARTFEATPPVTDIAGWVDVAVALSEGTAQVVDARTPERFSGALPSGYPGLAPGHMPGAVNLPWTTMLHQDGDYRFSSPEEAEAAFRAAGVDPDQPIIATCGSGVTAAVLAFQLLRMGKTDWTIYDGSWNEWGRRSDLPRESLGTADNANG
ncbi:sulfurtransferase [Chelatococcus asaccharovorans]|uniref:Thiosulfate/3-mercaptopyruvate sulfurtransferase n=1 Tax=Chelatococcus asaccharovorans TaxID=28210 RepID=A0A2V3UGM6_9HYPH|nr:sulfurtransferase [Chelatococcus asaccharovorans]MBS7707183.1 sulfurtransferase [Chelatococcus asaccharovorans]PXW63365.1 thiosulfate/3-mercaptopyruvate sulfurtransferase [Chelatococcus asaccharovorans]